MFKIETALIYQNKNVIKNPKRKLSVYLKKVIVSN